MDGPGFRTSIYLSGCCHHCPACQNPQSWDEFAGMEMSLEELMEIVEEEDFDVTLTGGDPLYHPEKLKLLIRALKENGRNVWVYSGYTWEEIKENPNLFSSVEEADVLIDGRYIDELRDLDLQFKGSSNQRIIDIKESIKEGTTVLYYRS